MAALYVAVLGLGLAAAWAAVKLWLKLVAAWQARACGLRLATAVALPWRSALWLRASLAVLVALLA